MTTIASSWMKAVDGPAASTSITIEPEVETLQLFQEHGTALFRFCRGVLGQTGDAEDVVQETFLKLLHHLQHGRDRRNLKSWLFTVAANACRDRTRWRLRWLPWNAERDDRTVDPIEPADDVRLKPDTTGTRLKPDTTGTGLEWDTAGLGIQPAATSLSRARRAFRALAPRDRLLLSLRTQGLSYKDIAGATGIRQQSVGRLLARAVDRWRKRCGA